MAKEAIRFIAKDHHDSEHINDIWESDVKYRKDGSLAGCTQTIFKEAMNRLRKGQFVFLELVNYDD